MIKELPIQASFQIHLRFHHVAAVILAILGFTIDVAIPPRTQIHFSLDVHWQLLL